MLAHHRSFNDDLNKLLEVDPKGTVRFHGQESGGWYIFIYELKENLNQIISLCKSVYLLAATAMNALLLPLIPPLTVIFIWFTGWVGTRWI